MANLTQAEVAEVEGLLQVLEGDDIQKKLRPGFETDFSNSILHQWQEKHWLSARQIELLRDLVDRHSDRRSSPGRPSRRYEGWTPSTRR